MATDLTVRDIGAIPPTTPEQHIAAMATLTRLDALDLAPMIFGADYDKETK